MELSELCSCGSGRMYGACCGAMEPCDCGSGQPAGSCCYQNEDDDEDAEE